MIKAPKKAEFEPIPAGNHVARLYQIIHIGTVPSVWQGQESMKDKVRLTFELCNEKKVFKEGDPEKPFSISREFTLSMGAKSALRPFIEGLGGVKLTDEEAYNFDLEVLLGQPCLLNVVHTEKDGNTYANIQNASPLPKGMVAPELFNEGHVIDVNDAAFSVIDALPDFIKAKMQSSEEYAGRVKHEENMAGGSKVSQFRPAVVKEHEVDPSDVPF